VKGGKGMELGYVANGGILLHRGRFYISKSSSLKNVLLREYHESLIGGHTGKYRILFGKECANM